jgi:hypothetical protein
VEGGYMARFGGTRKVQQEAHVAHTTPTAG